MTAAVNERMRIGVQNLHYAVMLTDTTAGITYQAAKALPAVNTITKKANSNFAVYYGDNGAADTATARGQIEIDIETTLIPFDDQNIMLGHAVVNGVATGQKSDNPPWIAIGFNSVKGDGTRTFMWLAKGIVKEPDEDYKTKTDKPEMQPQKFSFAFIMRNFDNIDYIKADENSATFLPSIATNWYDTTVGPLVKAASTFAITPIKTAAVAAGGTGYSVGDVLSIAGGTGATATVATISTGGVVTGVTLTADGSGYSAATEATTGGEGTGCTVTVTV